LADRVRNALDRPRDLCDPDRVHDLPAAGAAGPAGHQEGLAMSDSTPEYPLHDAVEEPPVTSPAIGHDEWVARHVERRLPPRLGVYEQRLRQVPWWLWLMLAVGLACLLPVVTASGYWRLVGFNTVIYAVLALGLNVVVGWGGLLDLGYVAFFGVGSYGYALLDSPHYGIHMWALLSVPIIVVVGAVFVLLRFMNDSRVGRAWRSQREDPLAAEVMGMPVSWLKLLSFSFGAAVAALAGTLFTALNASAFPLTFYFVTLITVYTMVILGG